MNAFNIEQPAAPVAPVAPIAPVPPAMPTAFDASAFAVPGTVIPTAEEHAAAVEAERLNKPVLKTTYHAEEDETIEYEDEEFEYSSNTSTPAVAQDMPLEAPESHPNERAQVQAKIEQPQVNGIPDPMDLIGEAPAAGTRNRSCAWAKHRPAVHAWSDAGYTPSQIMRCLDAMNVPAAERPKLATLQSYLQKRKAKVKAASKTADKK